MSDSTAKYGGASGATVDIHTDWVIKEGSGSVGTRVAQQGRWLLDNTATCLPRVWNVTGSRYVMERLMPVPAGMLGFFDLFKVMTALYNEVWSGEATVTFDLKAHQLKVGKLLAVHMPHDHMLQNTMTKLLENMMSEKLRTCRTHGDPTFGNMMTRPESYDWVISDPIPATPAVPDLHVVDLGKILQSIVGFEKARHGKAIHDHSIDEESFLTTFIGPNRTNDTSEDRSVQTVVYWCLVHLLRALPYAPQFEQRLRIKGCMSRALDLL